MKTIFFYLSVILLFPLLSLFSQTKDCTITIDGLERTYLLHLPEKTASFYNLPLVFVFHGGGGTGKLIMNETGFNKLSDRDRFIAVYPDGLYRAWNDGREKKEKGEMKDDVKFISRLIDTIYKQYNIDTSRIFATGISNGGFFSFYLAYKLSNKFLAIAPVCANIPKNLKDFYKPENPVSLMLINGTEDPLVKYEGGKVGFRFGKSRGKSLSTDESISIFKKLDKCSDKAKTEDIPDVISDDECYATKYTYSGGINNTDVILIKITNGGHTWSGGTQYLPKKLVGNLCKDFKAEDVIWGFFKSRNIKQ
ncbi:MAG: esterase [Ignavibacteriae bacterium]|nr:esterase [Ignavibacteriota bacterium]